MDSLRAKYDFNGNSNRLHESTRELAHHLHRQYLEAVATNGTILLEGHNEFLAQTETETKADQFRFMVPRAPLQLVGSRAMPPLSR